MAGVRCLGPPNAQRQRCLQSGRAEPEHRLTPDTVYSCIRSRTPTVISHPLPMRYAYMWNDACERERQTELQLDGRLMERVGLWLCAVPVAPHATRVRRHSTSVPTPPLLGGVSSGPYPSTEPDTFEAQACLRMAHMPCVTSPIGSCY